MPLDETLDGWQIDPHRRYEERFFVFGEPTRLVRAHGVEVTDPAGAGEVPSASTQPSTPLLPQGKIGPSHPRYQRMAIIVLGVTIGAGLAAGGARLVTRSGSSDDETYLTKVAQIAAVSRYGSTVERQRGMLVTERDELCNARDDAAVVTLAKRADQLRRSNDVDRVVLADGYRAAAMVSCPAKRAQFENALAAAEGLTR